MEGTKSLDGDDYVYVYGVTRGDCGAGALAQVAEGILPGTPVKLAAIGRPTDPGGLQAIYSPVPASLFALTAAKGIEDPAWVAERVVAHHRVLDACIRRFTVAPIKFGAVRRSLADVEELVSSNGAGFAETLDRVEGALEWGVKLHGNLEAYRQAAGETSPALENLRTELLSAAPGKAFFLRKKMLELADAEARSGLIAEANRVHFALRAEARDGVLARPSRSAEDKRQGALLLSAAYLVEKGCEDQFHQAARLARARLPAGCFTLRVTGPWPPYSFVDLMCDPKGGNHFPEKSTTT